MNQFANVWRIWNHSECHGNATAWKAYVADTLHDHLLGIRAAKQLRKLSMLWRCCGVLRYSRYAIHSQTNS